MVRVGPPALPPHLVQAFPPSIPHVLNLVLPLNQWFTFHTRFLNLTHIHSLCECPYKSALISHITYNPSPSLKPHQTVTQFYPELPDISFSHPGVCIDKCICTLFSSLSIHFPTHSLPHQQCTSLLPLHMSSIPSHNSLYCKKWNNMYSSKLASNSYNVLHFPAA